MTGVTANGLPYPDPSDPVSKGADDIKALALALPSNRITTVVPSDTTDVTALPSAWPDGLSTAYYTTSGAGGAWPIRPCQVVTLRRGGTPVAQWCIPHTTTNPRVFYRAGSASSEAWSDWVGATAPYGSWYGTFNVTALAVGASKDTTVTFPSGRFTLAPTCTGVIGSPRYGYQILSRSATSAMIRCANYTGADATSTTAVEVGFVQARQGGAVGRSEDEAPEAQVPEPIPGHTYYLAVCQTEGCGNHGRPIVIDGSYTDPDTGELVTAVPDVVCGVCGLPITVEVFPT
jgi:hypothetical protein